MIKNSYKVIGAMSGTSLDGLDLAYIAFVFSSSWSFKIEVAETIPYNDVWINNLKNLSQKSSEELKKLDDVYTDYLVISIKDFIKRNRIKEIDAVCSHGHTALHEPEKGITYQIGNQSKLADSLEQTVVCDFRKQDVELGGQGAPLVPIGDELLFSDYDFCLNLGGFSNISTNKEGQRIAYDICPVNIVLNHYTRQLGFDFDEDGKISKSGKIHSELLEKLNDLDYYRKQHPKSLGIEWVEENIFPIIDNYHLNVETILRTFVEHIAIQISKEIKSNGKVLITGGGVYNLFLMESLKKLSKSEAIVPDKKLIDFKEALIFGLLGVLKLRNEVNCLQSVTGATKDHSSGIIFWKSKDL